MILLKNLRIKLAAEACMFKFAAEAWSWPGCLHITRLTSVD